MIKHSRWWCDDCHDLLVYNIGGWTNARRFAYCMPMVLHVGQRHQYLISQRITAVKLTYSSDTVANSASVMYFLMLKIVGARSTMKWSDWGSSGATIYKFQTRYIHSPQFSPMIELSYTTRSNQFYHKASSSVASSYGDIFTDCNDRWTSS